MKVLISTNHMNTYSGSEIVSLEIASYFRSKDASVDFFAFNFEEAFLKEIESCGAVAIYDIPDISVYDLVWSHHGMLDVLLGPHLLGKRRPFVVSNHMSPYELYELVGLKSISRNADLILANSEETRRVLAGYLGEEDIMIFPNPVPDSFSLKVTSGVAELKKIAVISNHIPDEVRSAISLLKSKEYEVVVVGMEGICKRVTPELLREFDIIISIGKTVQYALMMGIPVYCYDHFGGPGYLNTENFENARVNNFSGRGFGKKNPQEIFAEIIGGYSIAQNYFNDIAPEVRNHFSLSRYMNTIVDKSSSRAESYYELHHIADLSEYNLYRKLVCREFQIGAALSRKCGRLTNELAEVRNELSQKKHLLTEYSKRIDELNDLPFFLRFLIRLVSKQEKY